MENRPPRNEMPTTDEPYAGYASIYDELGQDQFSQELMPLVQLLLDRYGVAPRAALDLACGTGAAALALARMGIRVVAVDRAEAMLRQARRKSATEDLSVSWLRQDMASLSIDESVELVVCLYDSLNHLLDGDALLRTFQRVSAALCPGGLFVFDVITPHCLAHHWSNRRSEEYCPSAHLLHEYSFDAESGIGTLELRITPLRENGAGHMVELYRERGIGREEAGWAVAASGMEMLEAISFPDLDPPTETTSRVIYVARKPLREVTE